MYHLYIHTLIIAIYTLTYWNSWLYNLFTSYIEEKIKDALKSQVYTPSPVNPRHTYRLCVFAVGV